jgi:DMSO/TMAO reductase YedYZ molybdopterin-dependent catalytic subunit
MRLQGPRHCGGVMHLARLRYTAAMNDTPVAALTLPGKDPRLVVLGDHPLVAETPASLLDDETTPAERFFIRNNGIPPQTDALNWTLAIDGEVKTPLTLTLAALQANYRAVTRHMVLECGGNGRAFFDPPAQGNAWTNGGVGCAAWTGVALADVLADAGLTSAAVYTAHYGADAPVTAGGKPALSRGVRVEKALEPHTMLVWGMNGAPLPAAHGGPLRLVVPGWPGSASQKWLTRITIRDCEHDGPGMTGFSYRLPVKPLIPGEVVDPSNFRVLESMPVRSIITSPADGARVTAAPSLEMRGFAWAGDNAVSRVEVSVDGGAWGAAALKPPRNRYDWQHWHAPIPLPASGAAVLRVRATDTAGNVQPETPTLWNPGGYGANAIHRVAVWVT